jgi:4-hydroxy-tetrahydrodipicolinate reductase
MAYRVIQWSTGNVGKSAMRAVAQHPDLELVGLLVGDPAKQGKDAGDLCGLSALGVAATTSLDEILALEADCVLHMPLPSTRIAGDPEIDLRNLCTLLESGKNVVTTVGYLYPRAYGEDVVARLEDACRRGGTSVHGTGVNPGWLGELLPLTMSAMSARIDQIVALESTDFSFYPSREVIFDMMGLGKQPDVFEEDSAAYRDWLGGLFRESVMMIADGLALELDDIASDFEYVVTEKEFEIAAGVIERGAVAGQRFAWAGIAGGERRIVLEAVYRANASIEPSWPQPGCRVEVAGRPRMTIELDEGWLSNGLVGTAMHAVHAVPHVCRAEPGIRTFLDLPLIVGRHAMRGARPLSG